MDAKLYKHLGTQGIYSCNVSGYKSNQLAIAFIQLQCLKIFKRLLTNLWKTLILGVQNTKYSVYIYISNLTKRPISYQWVIITLYCWWIMESSALYLVKNNISRWTKQTLFIENNFWFIEKEESAINPGDKIYQSSVIAFIVLIRLSAALEKSRYWRVKYTLDPLWHPHRVHISHSQLKLLLIESTFLLFMN